MHNSKALPTPGTATTIMFNEKMCIHCIRKFYTIQTKQNFIKSKTLIFKTLIICNLIMNRYVVTRITVSSFPYERQDTAVINKKFGKINELSPC